MRNDQTNESAVTITRTPRSRESSFTCREWVALLQLRRRYQVGHDLWSAHEVERLRFLRWLYTTDQMES
ncbi:MAG TPA: hypothetical protein VFQ32_13160 [Ktedonobacterales bacterium]|nr:hypothetical protein [Ktedonobacterales bacterium]